MSLNLSGFWRDLIALALADAGVRLRMKRLRCKWCSARKAENYRSASGRREGYLDPDVQAEEVARLCAGYHVRYFA
jgi:hypothetical protein